jgi:Mn2+/Fe2+ NRAMP family transporter
MRIKNLLSIIGPGILVAATGVGAGDLATAAFAGSKLGTAVLWLVLLGAAAKYVLNEGLARWQLTSGKTLLEGALKNSGLFVQILFLLYFLVWSYLVAAALMNAVGAVMHAIFPLFDPRTDKIIYGILLSMIGTAMIYFGGFRLFEKFMGVFIGLMFLIVVVFAVLLIQDTGAIFRGIFIPDFGVFNQEESAWSIALVGGVGGTLTLLNYSYWIQEKGRQGLADLRTSRIDLALAYSLTAIFGMAMVIIGNNVQISGSGVNLLVNISDQFVLQFGLAGKWIFLVGAFGAIFSSLLGVWQGVPYLFADVWQIIRKEPQKPGEKIKATSAPYRFFLFAMATVPMIGLWTGFAKMQKLYAITGALFMPMLALALIILLNGKWEGQDRKHKNSIYVNLILVLILAFFVYFTIHQ